MDESELRLSGSTELLSSIDPGFMVPGVGMSRFLVTQYQAEVEKIIRYGGSKKEISIRNAFEQILNDYCKPRNYLLIPELDYKTRLNTTVFPDGTIKDAIRLEHGWWESKDEYE